MATTNKIEKEKKLQLKEDSEAAIKQALLFSKKRFKKFDEIIVQLYNNEDMRFAFSDRRIWKVNDCFAGFSSKEKSTDRKKLKDVLLHLNAVSDLLKEEKLIHAVYNMFLFNGYWINNLIGWKPTARLAEAQLKELAAYLFCRYKVPAFLFQCFNETVNTRYVYWFIHIGTGGKVKEVGNIPIPFTQKMAHYFLQAPDKLTIPEALRWAQVRGLNGDYLLAEKIAYSWLSSKPYADEDFWEQFIRLVINAGMFNQNKLTELIDYTREMKRANGNYSLKGRTLETMFRQSDIWHKQFSNSWSNQVWKPCGINGFRVEKKSELILLEELTEAKLLSEEGKVMKHCVGSYAFYCMKGKSAIFSLRKYTAGVLLDVMATVEVHVASQRIVQAKAKMNRPISYEARKYMEAWATHQHLSINPFV